MQRFQKYTPQPPEPVLGIIIARHAEGYRVDIGSSQAAALDALAFEGATKRNKPNLKVRTIGETPLPCAGIASSCRQAILITRDCTRHAQVGTLVYGHLLATPPFSEPEISCVDPSTQKASGFGELAGGFLIRHVELGRCRACVLVFPHPWELQRRLLPLSKASLTSPWEQITRAQEPDTQQAGGEIPVRDCCRYEWASVGQGCAAGRRRG